MLIRRLPKAESERRWRRHYAERIDKARRKHENRVKGLDLVFQLFDGRKLEFRGRHYGVPPVPWPLGVKMFALQERLNALIAKPDSTLAEWEALYAEVAHLFNRLTIPEDAGPLKRLLWRWWPSPARNVTIPEVVQLIGFFCLCVTLGHGGSSTENQTTPPRGTSRSTSFASPRTAPPRSTRRASLAPGSTS